MKILDVAKTIVLNDRGEVLLLRRSKSDTNRPGEWDFPGGHVEAGEDFAAAASREIAEESGLKILEPELQLVFTSTTAYDELGVNRLLFIAHVQQLDIRLSEEHDDYRWVSVETALQEFPHPFYNVGLQYAQDHNLL